MRKIMKINSFFKRAVSGRYRTTARLLCFAMAVVFAGPVIAQDASVIRGRVADFMTIRKLSIWILALCLPVAPLLANEFSGLDEGMPRRMPHPAGEAALKKKESIQNALWGKVTDSLGTPLAGVSVKVRDSNLGTVTDVGGAYHILLPSDKEVMVFSYIGYETQERPVSGPELDVILVSIAQTLGDVVVVGYGTQKKINVTGSISSVNMADMRTPVPNLSNALAGKVAGIISVQSSGEPGYDQSTFTIRGIGTFTGNTQPLVIVDGVQRDDVNSSYGGAFNNIDPEDIASISLLKDASSTAMYGAKGANGVLIITTKRGIIGKPKIALKTESGRTGFTKTPELLNGVQYMELLNEARTNGGLSPAYSDEQIQKTASGLDPYMYPDVKWIEEVYRNSSALTNANLNISGGGEISRYFLSASFYNQQGPYKVSEQNGFNPNLDFKRYDFRTNIDVNVTPSTLLQLNLGAMLVDSRYPGITSGNLWYLSFATTPIAFPVKYPDGRWAGPLANGGNNPLNDVQNNGYTDEFRPAVQSVFTVNQRLDALGKGLSSYVRFSFDSYGSFFNQRQGQNDLWIATGRDGNGELQFVHNRIGQQFLGYAQRSAGERVMYLEGNVNYDRTFGVHGISGMVLYNMRNRLFSTAGDVIGSIPFRNQSFAGKVTYGFDDRYLLEANIGYTGSENFERGRRFGLFPSVSGGWVISNEDFFSGISDRGFRLLKIRGSYGVVGNDNIGTGRRFPYLTQIGPGRNTGFGLNAQWNGGLTEQQIGVENLTWERAYKAGAGLEVGLYDKISLIMDLFSERRKDILIERSSISSIAGYSGSVIYANLGEMKNRGMDANIEYTDKVGRLGVRVFGNVTYSRNEIVHMDEPNRRYAYQRATGRRFGEFTGYISEGFFPDLTAIDAYPEQRFSEIAPGDLRYRNLNPQDDDVIDAYDFTYLGKSAFPSWMYGAGFSLAYKGFDVSLFIQGAADVGIMANGAHIPGAMGAAGVGVLPFSGIGQFPNNALSRVLDRWTPENPREDAYYPRLTLSSLADNNYLGSTHWLKDGSFVRLKQASVGYNIPTKAIQRFGCSVLYLYLSGNNLLTFSKFKLWDPELGSNGAKYPITRMATVGIRAQF